MHNEHIMHIITLPISSARVGSKHIPGMMIPYSPVTEVYTGYLLYMYVEVLIQMSKYPVSCLQELSYCFIVSTFLTDSMCIIINGNN